MVYWLLDRPLAGCLVTEQGGLTKIIQTDDTQEQIIPHILVALAGMKMGSDQEAVFELEDHIDNPARFHAKTDSRIVADAMRAFKRSQRRPLFRQFCVVLSRVRTRFRKAYAEIRRRLAAPPHQLFFAELNQLFRKWDLEYGFDRRPKSDYGMRMFRRIAHQPLPKGQWLDWDTQALSEWRYRPASLKDIVRLIFQEESRHLVPASRWTWNPVWRLWRSCPRTCWRRGWRESRRKRRIAQTDRVLHGHYPTQDLFKSRSE